MAGLFRTVLAIAALGALLAGCAGGTTPPGTLGSRSAKTSSPVTVARPKVPASEATFAFEPFIGVPGNTADELSRKIGEKARLENLKLVRRVDGEATYRVRGYLTAAGNKDSAVVSYVFDVFSGDQRLYRFNGQEISDGTRGDPWAGVDSDALENMASRIVLSLKSWLGQ